MTRDGVAYPDTWWAPTRTPRWSTGLGVLGWGVGGIEAEAAMLGRPVSMLIPRVVGFKLTGEIQPAVTATDVVLTVTEMLRKHGVVGKFVEFYGEGVAEVPLANRATLGNMSPEFGSTAAIFPIDEETISYLKFTGRGGRAVGSGRGIRQRTGLVARSEARAEAVGVLRARPVRGGAVDRRAEAPAGPNRVVGRQVHVPQDHSRLCRATTRTSRSTRSSTSRSPSLSRPAIPGRRPTDMPTITLRVLSAAAHANGRVSNPVDVKSDERGEFVLDHGAVVIAAVTSCTRPPTPR